MTIADQVQKSPSDTHWQVLKALRACGRATVNDVVQRVNVKSVTVRHHLNRLHAEGLVSIDEQRQGVGRPVNVYMLTPKAERLFPRSAHLLMDRLLEQMKSTLPASQFEGLIESLARSLADDVRGDVAHLSPDERRERLVESLDELGLSASWRQTDEGLQLVKYHCPYHVVGNQHPELCQIDEALVRAVVEVDVERAACLLSGDSACALTVGGDILP